MLLSLPLASVALLAWVFDNPFNGAVFALTAVALLWLARRGDRRTPVHSADPWSLWVGLALVGFAWVYPHFLMGHSALVYLYAAPMGVIPCPTLSLVVGAALMGGLTGGGWRILLTLVALFYALLGMVRLGVWLDVGLLLGALALFAQHWQMSRERGRHREFEEQPG